MTRWVTPHNLTTTFAYSGSLLATVTEPNGDVTTFSYDGNNHLARITEPGNRVTTVSIDAVASSITSPTRTAGCGRSPMTAPTG